MSMDRRQFLKIAGISSILGLGASAAATASHNIWVKGIQPPDVETNKEALTAQHWAMVVDMSKFKTEEDFQKTISACHTTHNVPDYGNIKDEIKWIWKTKYENAFPDQDNPYNDKMKEMPFIVMCNHCENPGMRSGLSDAGDLQAQIGRHRDDGHASLHRLPVLHGRLPIRRQKF